MKEWSENLYYKINRPALSLCMSLGITPNQVTIFNHFLTLTVGIWGFSRGNWGGNALGLIVMLINGYLDYLDGDLAKKTRTGSNLGEWLDSGFDVVIQNAVMAAIAIGCFKQGLPIWVIAFFFVGNSASNLVSFKLNSVFCFSSSKGNEKFRNLMSFKPSIVNRFIKNIIDPTSSRLALFLYTVRYFIVIGVFFNIMPLCFAVVTLITNLKWLLLFVIYSLYLKDYPLWVVECLKHLDDEKEEYYK